MESTISVRYVLWRALQASSSAALECRLVHSDPNGGRLHSRVGVAYGVPHSASLLSLPPHQVQILPTSPLSAGSLIRGVGGAKL